MNLHFTTVPIAFTPQGRELLTHHLEAATSEYAAIFQSPLSGGALEQAPAPGLFSGGSAENAPPTAAAGTPRPCSQVVCRLAYRLVSQYSCL